MPQTWSTLAEAPGGQFVRWREVICAAFLALTPESDLRDGFAGTVTQRTFGALSLAQIDSQRQRVRRTEADIARAPRPGHYANLQVSGVSRMRQGGRETLLRPGDLAVVDTGEPFTFDFGDDFRQLSFFVPSAVPLPTATRVSTAGGVGAAVRHALQALNTSPLAQDSAERLARYTGGLLAIALEPPVAAAVAPRSHALAVADIEEHLTDDDLSPATTARRLGISVRRLHGLFAGSGGSYAGTVRRLRLDLAYRDLADPARDHLRVIDVAADAGFGNVAAFHRAFRRAYGRTPGDLRSSRH